MKFSKQLKKCNNFKERACCLYLGLTRSLISLSQVNQVHLGTQVIYNGKKMYVVNRHVCAGGVVVWELASKRRPDTDDEVYTKINATEDEFDMILSLDNIKNDATWWWKWYRDSWLNIDYMAMARGEELCSVRIIGKEAAHGKNKTSKKR